MKTIPRIYMVSLQLLPHPKWELVHKSISYCSSTLCFKLWILHRENAYTVIKTPCLIVSNTLLYTLFNFINSNDLEIQHVANDTSKFSHTDIPGFLQFRWWYFIYSFSKVEFFLEGIKKKLNFLELLPPTSAYIIYQFTFEYNLFIHL